MIEIETKNIPLIIWYDMIKWCIATFGPCKDDEWMWQDDHSLYISEKNLPFFILRWSS